MTIIAHWPAPKNIQALTTTRQGGVSLVPYDSLNIAHHVGDEQQAVNKNRQRVIQQHHLPSSPCYLDQVHSNLVTVLTSAIANPVTADAVYTRQNQVVCAIMTADCLPILLCSEQGDEVAAIHAGWRGLVSHIIENTLMYFQQPRSRLMAWLGPAIGPDQFEVGNEVREQFIHYQQAMASAFTACGNNKYLADIYQLARLILQQQGVEAIYGGEYCTVTQKEQFFSYRREKQTGRMVSLIWKKA